MTLYGRTVESVHRFASTSTAIAATVRLFARSSAPHGDYKRSKSLVRTIGCGVLPLLVSGWRCVRVRRTSAECTATTNAPNPWYEQSAVVYCHCWFRVGDASECAEQALSARRLQTPQIPGTNNRLWCIAIIGFGLEMRPSAPNKR